MKLIKLTCILVLAFSMMHCSKSEEKVTLIYNQTQCADPWETSSGNTDEEIIDSIESYFDIKYGLDIEVLNISDSNNVAACFACTCPSGRVITACVDEQFSDELETEGFVIP